jgi:hypothetical protein
MGWLVPALKRYGVQTIADVAGGSGHHAERLRAEGFRTALLDSSPAMLAEASRRLGPSGTVVRCDIMNLGSVDIGTFDAVVCLGNSLAAFGQDGITAFFRGARKRVRPGGLLMVHCLNYHRFFRPARYTIFERDDVTLPDGTAGLLRRELVMVEPAPMRQDSSIELTWIAKGTSTPEHTASAIAPCHPWKILPIAKAAGWSFVEAIGDWNGRPYQPVAGCPIWTAVWRLGP